MFASRVLRSSHVQLAAYLLFALALPISASAFAWRSLHGGARLSLIVVISLGFLGAVGIGAATASRRMKNKPRIRDADARRAAEHQVPGKALWILWLFLAARATLAAWIIMLGFGLGPSGWVALAALALNGAALVFAKRSVE